jgi:hypothetical protein
VIRALRRLVVAWAPEARRLPAAAAERLRARAARVRPPPPAPAQRLAEEPLAPAPAGPDAPVRLVFEDGTEVGVVAGPRLERHLVHVFRSIAAARSREGASLQK